jgi:hypothetical protein
VNCPGPYAYDGRAGRRPGITEAHRAVVTYSLSWIAAVVADMPQQLYFRRAYGGNASSGILMHRVGQFSSLVARFADFLTAPPALTTNQTAHDDNGIFASTGYQPRAVLVEPAVTTRAALWQRPDETSFCALIVVVNLVAPPANASVIDALPPSPISFSFASGFAARWPEAASAKAVCVDGGAKSGAFEHGVMKGLELGFEDSAVFLVGECT